ncbi:IclR family transcriptional regulator [Rhodobacteraceae bacterium NNCM2]|nr:IclR family transcriptional regulator [Coraliihabitans acroporae]
MSETSTKDRQFVTALARGLDVLRTFKPGDGALTNTEIASRTGLPKATVSRLTGTLTELGYLYHSKSTGAYQLGTGVLALGYAMLNNIDLRERARPFMKELADEASVTVALGARDRLSVVYLEVCKGPQIITISRNVGERLPIETTAMGLAILATLPEAERDYLLRALRERDAASAVAAEKAIAIAAEQIAKQGFCTSFGGWIPDVNAVAAPVVSVDGENVFAINIGGPSFMVSREHLTENLGPRLAEISRMLAAPTANSG